MDGGVGAPCRVKPFISLLKKRGIPLSHVVSVSFSPSPPLICSPCLASLYASLLYRRNNSIVCLSLTRMTEKHLGRGGRVFSKRFEFL